MDWDQPKKQQFLDQYRIVKHLGAGYQAQVKLAVGLQGEYVAIKKYKQETSTLQNLQQELAVMQELHHQNLIKLISVRQNATFRREDQSSYHCFAIVLEYAGGGELFDYVAETGKFSEKVARTYFHQMMNGIHYMHERGYAHRDIKPQNLLLSDKFVLKIADFGFSCLLKGRDGTGVLKTKLGTQGYMAPQIASKQYDGRQVDIFASGVILFIMYSGNPPFQKATSNDPYYKLIKQKRFDLFWQAHGRRRPYGFFSQSFRDLIQRMLSFAPNERPNIYDIAKHPWVKSSICTHSEIIQQFNNRKIKLEEVLEQRRNQQQQERVSRSQAINTKGTTQTGPDQEDKQEFTEAYIEEKLNKRKIDEMSTTLPGDIIVKDMELQYLISTLKVFIRKHEIDLAEDIEQGDEFISEQVNKLKLQDISDDHHKVPIIKQRQQ